MNKQKLIPIILIIVSAALAVISYIVLPETVIVQISVGGSPATTMPKLIAVLLPFALGAGGAVSGLSDAGEAKSQRKWLIISGVGILVFAVMLIVNLAF